MELTLTPIPLFTSITYFSQFQDTTDALHCNIHLPACLWIITLTAELQRRLQAMEMRCYHKILCISYKDLVNNEEVCAMIQQAFRLHKDLLSIVKKNTNCSGMVMSPVHQIWLKPSFNARWKGEENKADRGRGGTTTSGNGETGVPKDPQGSGEQGKMKKTGCKIICGAPTTLVVTG